jgi:hypothetical protein
MENIVPTAYANQLASCRKLGRPYTIQKFTTMNEKLGFNASAVLQPGTYPITQYYAIGDGGHAFVAKTTGNGSTIMPLQHTATDANLFNQIPFILRLPSNDLDPTTMLNYAMRGALNIAGVDYIAYWLRRVDLSSVAPVLQLRTVANGVTSVTAFVPDATNLSPVANQLAPTGVNVISGDYICSSAQVEMDMSAFEIAELMNVFNILYGNTDSAIISEMVICSGIDLVQQITVGTATINFNDAVCVQADTFIADFKLITYDNAGITRLLDIGTNSPITNIGS